LQASCLETIAGKRAQKQSEAERAARKAPKLVRLYSVESHGVDHAQYFPGAGVSHTVYDDCFTGCGSSEREALEDALESFYQSGEYAFAEDYCEDNPSADRSLFDCFPTKPELTDYSEHDSVTETIEDNLPSIPDAEWAFRLYPYNGCGPIERGSVYDSREAALGELPNLRKQFEEAGQTFEEVEPFSEWETQFPGQGVGDTEGLLCLEQINAGAIREAEQERESAFEDSELHYYVTLYVAQLPEEGSSEHYTIWDGDDSSRAPGEQWLVCESDTKADSAAREAIRESLWSFSLDFLREYFRVDISDAALESLKSAQEKLCEDFGPIVASLLGDNRERAESAAIAADGRGHFLGQYNGAEVCDPDGIVRYRIN
jgi:hypothetical protein